MNNKILLPGECSQFIRNDLDYVNAIILAKGNSTDDEQHQVKQSDNLPRSS